MKTPGTKQTETGHLTRLLRKLFLMASIIFSFDLFCQTTYTNSLPGIQWASTGHYETGGGQAHDGEDWFENVIETSDGGYLAVGYTTTWASNTSTVNADQPFAAKFDKFGKKIWEHVYVYNNDYYADGKVMNAFEETGGSPGYILMGDKGMAPVNYTDAVTSYFYLKVDKATGNIITNFKMVSPYDLGYDDAVYDINGNPNNDYEEFAVITNSNNAITGFLCASVMKDQTLSAIPPAKARPHCGLIIKWDANGDLDTAWGIHHNGTYYAGNNNTQAYLKGICVEYDGAGNPTHIVYSGAMLNPGDYDIYVGKIDMSGTVTPTWEHLYDHGYLESNFSYPSTLLTPLTGTGVAGKSDKDLGYYIKQIQPGGDLIMDAQLQWSIEPNNTTTFPLLNQIAGNLDFGLALIKLSASTGNISWAKFLDHSTGIDFYCPIDVLPGGTGFLIGTNDASDPNYLFNKVIKTNASGTTTLTNKYLDAQAKELSNCMLGIVATSDGGIIISGNSDYQKYTSGLNQGNEDFELIKLAPDCNALQTYTITGSGLANTFTVGTTTWNSSKNINAQVVVTTGHTLTISGSTTVIRFADSKMTGLPAGIVVQPGAKLDIQSGVVLTSIDNTACPGSMWDGIRAIGTSSDQGAYNNYSNITTQGFVSINSATISNARVGIVNCSPEIAPAFGATATPHGPGGGVIKADNAYFINNQQDIQMWDYYLPYANKCVFNNSHFLINNVLNYGEGPVQRVFMQNINGVKFNGCEFAYNAGSVYEPTVRGFGIQANHSVFTVGDFCGNSTCTTFTQSTLSNFTRGIQANNGNPLRTVTIDHAIFTNTFTGAGDVTSAIVLISPYAAQVTNNSITTKDDDGEGMFLTNCKNYSVRNNTITQNGVNANSGTGIRIASSGAGSHKAYRNSLNNLWLGIQSQWNNSGSVNNTGDPSDGLLMNCNTFTNNAYDIALCGDTYTPANIPCVRENQGLSIGDPKRLVRNQYAASCGNNSGKWYIENSSKTIAHPTHTDAITQPNPQPSCSPTLVSIAPTSTVLNFAVHCLENESTPSTGAGPIHRLADIGTALSGARARTNTLSSTYNSSLDGGDTQTLLNLIGVLDPNTLTSNLSGYSPYLSDTVLKAFFNVGADPASNVISIHNLNRPVTADVWSFLMGVPGLSGDNIDTLTAHQALNPISQRRALEDELGNAKAELQFIYSEKLNYFLTDTLDAATDTVIKLLSDNLGSLPDAPMLKVNAYANGNYYTRAFAYADSLGAIDKYEEIVALQKVILQLDTAQAKHFKITTDSGLNDVISEYAVDSTKAGSWLARAIMYEVYGKDMNLIRLSPSGGGNRDVNPGNATPGEGTKNKALNMVSHLKIYPNPSQNSFTISYNSVSKSNAFYTIRDILGKEVMNGTINPNTSQEIDTRRLDNGIYLITLMKDNKPVEKQKLIVMK